MSRRWEATESLASCAVSGGDGSAAPTGGVDGVDVDGTTVVVAGAVGTENVSLPRDNLQNTLLLLLATLHLLTNATSSPKNLKPKIYLLSIPMQPM